MTAPLIAPDRLYGAIEATWPPLSTRRLGPWTIRKGAGGGSRVSAATLEGEVAGLDEAEAAMRALGQAPLVMVRAGQEALDETLAGRGYAVKDPVVTYAAAPAGLAGGPGGDVTAHWPPTEEQREIWAEGGIGPERLAVMARVAGPKTALLGRLGEEPAGTAFVAMQGGLAMLHALDVRATHRRRGLARQLMFGASAWAQAEGAKALCLLVTRANTGANALYRGLGMQEQGGYHYRALPA
ncbi:GNAT family N-acetyltransferase [Pseudoroseicyclus sp. H15]